MRLSRLLGSLVLIGVVTGSPVAGSDTGSLIVKARGKGAVVVFLEPAGAERFDATPGDGTVMSLASSDAAPRVSLDQKDLTFVPHILAIEEGTVVDFINSDDLLHNVHLYRGSNMDTLINVAMPLKGMRLSYTFHAPLEVVVLCDVHTEMSNYILVLPNGYFAQADANGEARIDNIQPGTYVVKMWREGKRKIKTKTVEITAGTNVVDLN